jgi:hypothetical protein
MSTIKNKNKVGMDTLRFFIADQLRLSLLSAAFGGWENGRFGFITATA